jgi:hypothetical protein
MQSTFTGVDKTFYKASKLEEQGNSDFQYWFDKTIEERFAAAMIMIAVSFREPDFLRKKVDRTIFSARKHTD